MQAIFPYLVGLSVDPTALPQQLVNGVMIGAIYALIALGYTMVYGVLRLINFAHGEVFMLGAYVALFTSWAMGFTPENVAAGLNKPATAWTLLIMLLAAMAACAIIGAVIEFFAYRPMRNQSRIAALITAIGVSLFIQYAGQLFLPVSPPPAISDQTNPFGDPVVMRIVPPPQSLVDQLAVKQKELDEATAQAEVLTGGSDDRSTYSEAAENAKNKAADINGEKSEIEQKIQAQSVNVTVTMGQIVMLSTVLVLMTILRWLVMKTPAGRAMRAVSHDFDTAALMGVNSNKVVTFTFMTGSALAGAGAMMLATFEGTTLGAFFGLQPGVKAFVAAVLGGIGNIPGAVLGGFLMGLAEALVTWVGFSQYKDAVAFIILIIVLLFRPGGILGSSAVEKV